MSIRDKNDLKEEIREDLYLKENTKKISLIPKIKLKGSKIKPDSRCESQIIFENQIEEEKSSNEQTEDSEKRNNFKYEHKEKKIDNKLIEIKDQAKKDNKINENEKTQYSDSIFEKEDSQKENFENKENRIESMQKTGKIDFIKGKREIVVKLINSKTIGNEKQIEKKEKTKIEDKGNLELKIENSPEEKNINKKKILANNSIDEYQENLNINNIIEEMVNQKEYKTNKENIINDDKWNSTELNMNINNNEEWGISEQNQKIKDNGWGSIETKNIQNNDGQCSIKENKNINNNEEWGISEQNPNNINICWNSSKQSQNNKEDICWGNSDQNHISDSWGSENNSNQNIDIQQMETEDDHDIREDIGPIQEGKAAADTFGLCEKDNENKITWFNRDGRNNKDDPFIKKEMERLLEDHEKFLARKEDKTSVESIEFKVYYIKVYSNEPPIELKEGKRPKIRFENMNELPEVLATNLKTLKFDYLTPIQRMVMPYIQIGKDIVCVAETGSGKTIAYLFPIIGRMLIKGVPENPYISKSDENKNKEYNNKKAYPLTLILVPTRELAIQVSNESKKLCFNTGIRTVAVYGGEGKKMQIIDLYKGCDILVATPGRLMDLMGKNIIDLKMANNLILDEADRMLDNNFYPDLQKIFNNLPARKYRQNLLFSATFDEEIKGIAKYCLNNYYFFKPKLESPKQIKHEFLQVYNDDDKINALKKILTKEENKDKSFLVFLRTKAGVDQLGKILEKDGIKCCVIHGDKIQYERNRSLREFITGNKNILIATDVASRGLDFPKVHCVINFDIPQNTDDYIHRVGRSGRSGQEGKALTFIDGIDVNSRDRLVKFLRKQNQEVPNWLDELVSERKYRFFGIGNKRKRDDKYDKINNDNEDKKFKKPKIEKKNYSNENNFDNNNDNNNSCGGSNSNDNDNDTNPWGKINNDNNSNPWSSSTKNDNNSSSWENSNDNNNNNSSQWGNNINDNKIDDSWSNSDDDNKNNIFWGNKKNENNNNDGNWEISVQEKRRKTSGNFYRDNNDSSDNNKNNNNNFINLNENIEIPEKACEELFIRGISYDSTEDDIRETFSKYGEIDKIKILKDRETQKSKGCGFVKFNEVKFAVLAMNDADNLICQGRNLMVRFSNDKMGEFKGKKRGPRKDFKTNNDSDDFSKNNNDFNNINDKKNNSNDRNPWENRNDNNNGNCWGNNNSKNDNSWEDNNKKNFFWGVNGNNEDNMDNFHDNKVNVKGKGYRGFNRKDNIKDDFNNNNINNEEWGSIMFD